MCCHSVVVIATAQFHSTKPELRFFAGSAQLEIRLNAFFQSTIPQKQFIIIIIQKETYQIIFIIKTLNL